MPLCKGCGGSYDDKFKFCPYCGRAKPEPVTLNVNVTSDDVWETCEICLVKYVEKFTGGLGKLLDLSKKEVWQFEATAIGPQGRYGAAWSKPLKRFYDYDRSGSDTEFYQDSCLPKVDALIKKLVSNGWQPTGRGEEWYSEKFRRKVKK